jgi:hypothetical protein
MGEVKIMHKYEKFFVATDQFSVAFQVQIAIDAVQCWRTNFSSSDPSGCEWAVYEKGWELLKAEVKQLPVKQQLVENLLKGAVLSFAACHAADERTQGLKRPLEVVVWEILTKISQLAVEVQQIAQEAQEEHLESLIKKREEKTRKYQKNLDVAYDRLHQYTNDDMARAAEIMQAASQHAAKQNQMRVPLLVWFLLIAIIVIVLLVCVMFAAAGAAAGVHSTSLLIPIPSSLGWRNFLLS